MARGLHAADRRRRLSLAPAVELANLLPSMESVVPDHHQPVGQVEFMRGTPAVAIDIVPISRFEAVERMPELELVLRIHGPPRLQLAASIGSICRTPDIVSAERCDPQRSQVL